ncbi:hypothetical protein FAI41_02220 [Acetobacteraceae bacterium]|nr:hypothetical protein FAI41_02220 [Acetobacteraceae bacterium]
MTCQENSKLKKEFPLLSRMFHPKTLPFLLMPIFCFPSASWAQMTTNLDALPGGAAEASPSPRQAPPSEAAPGGFSNNYNANSGGESSGIVSSQQAQQAADNLGISSNYAGAAFPKRQENPPSGENSPPLAPARTTPPATAAHPPYEKGIVSVNRAGTTIVPRIPASPPPLILAPPFPIVHLHPPVDPDPVIAVKGAISDTRPLANSLEGIRIEFAPLKEEMDQETIDAISRFGSHMAHNPNIRLTLEGFAGSQDDDPSLPRRLALQRLLEIRSLLMRAGVASTRIYPKTIGTPRPNTHETNGPADRVDIYPEENPNELIPEDDTLSRAQKNYSSKS